MKKLSEFYKRLNHAHQVFLLAAAVVLSMAAFATTSTAAAETPQLMFVQSAEDLKVDAAKSTFRLVKVNQQTMYFSDRPQRIVGHIKMADYLKEWTAKAGKDNFGADPPNATLSVYEPGKAENTIVVVKLTNPVVDGADLIYSYKVLNGTMPANGGATALFIDWSTAWPCSPTRRRWPRRSSRRSEDVTIGKTATALRSAKGLGPGSGPNGGRRNTHRPRHGRQERLLFSDAAGARATAGAAGGLRRAHRQWFDTAASGVRHFVPTAATRRWTGRMAVHLQHDLLQLPRQPALAANYDLTTDTYHTTWAEPGINCETCHGPAEEHVRVMPRRAQRAARSPDLKIIRAEKFSDRRAEQRTCALLPRQDDAADHDLCPAGRPVLRSLRPGDPGTPGLLPRRPRPGRELHLHLVADEPLRQVRASSTASTATPPAAVSASKSERPTRPACPATPNGWTKAAEHTRHPGGQARGQPSASPATCR